MKSSSKTYISFKVFSFIPVKSFTGSKLVLYDANLFTSGTFICIASNGHPPSVSRVLTLKVMHAPRVEIMEASSTKWISRREILSLSCRYAAYPLPRVVFHLENFQRRHNWSHSLFEIKSLQDNYPFT